MIGRVRRLGQRSGSDAAAVEYARGVSSAARIALVAVGALTLLSRGVVVGTVLRKKRELADDGRVNRRSCSWRFMDRLFCSVSS